mmetsp:Transcript_38226/g.50358  ORF Transcript_38226/g.50358 Transcript_38226/m.50358 type:complete len:212 (+) Transcript_38226:348-983(+)
MYLTPSLDAWSMESRKGKKASLERPTSVRVLSHSVFSASVSISGTVLKLASQTGRSASVMSPSMYRTRALTRSCLFTPSLKSKPITFGCWRIHQMATFRPASFTQSTRLCWPAPTPTIWPDFAKPTELDWVYFRVIEARIRSRLASSGRGAWVFKFCRWSAEKTTVLRACENPIPSTSLYSTGGAWKSGFPSNTMNFPPFFFFRISNAAGS